MNTGTSTLPNFKSLDIVDGRWVLTLSNGAQIDKGSAMGTAGSAGPAGIGITHTDVVSGNLLVTYSDGTVVNAGHVLGEPGTAGATGRGIVAAEVVGGRLKLTFSDNTVSDLGVIQGPAGKDGAAGAAGTAGRGIASSVIQAGRLVIGYTDGTFTDAGYVMGATGAAGRGISSTAITGGHLIITYTDGSTEDKGQVVGASGAAGAAYAGNPTLIGLSRIVVWSTDSANQIATYRVLYPGAGRTYTWSLVGVSVENALAISAAGDLSTVKSGFDGVAAEGTITVTVRATDDQGATLDQAITVVRRVAAAGGANVATLRLVAVGAPVRVTASNASLNLASITPAGATMALFRAIGGGASGFCARADQTNGIMVEGHGGAAGGVKERLMRIVDAPLNLSVTIGAGGAATNTNATSCNSNGGGQTTVAGVVSALGGIGYSYATLAEFPNPISLLPPSDYALGCPGIAGSTQANSSQSQPPVGSGRTASPSFGPGSGGAGSKSQYNGAGCGGWAGIGRPDTAVPGSYPDYGATFVRGGNDAPNGYGFGSGGSASLQYDTGASGNWPVGAGNVPGGGGGGTSTSGGNFSRYGNVSGAGGRGELQIEFFRYEAP